MSEKSQLAPSETEDASLDSLFPDLPVRTSRGPEPRVGQSVPPPPPRRSHIAQLVPNRRHDEELAPEHAEATPAPSAIAPAPTETGPRRIVAREGDEEGEALDEEALEEHVLEDEPTTLAPVGDLRPASLPPPPPQATALPEFDDEPEAVMAASAEPAASAPSSRVADMQAPAQVAPIAASTTPQSVAEALGVAHVAAQSFAPVAVQPVAPTSNRSPLVTALVVAAVIALCFGYYMFDAKSAPGVVQVTAQPLDAVVLFDGVAIGSVSPVLKTGIAPGERHRLEVKRDGYAPWIQEIEVTPGQTLFFPVTLQPLTGAAVTPAAQPAAVPTPPTAVAPAVVAEQPVVAAQAAKPEASTSRDSAAATPSEERVQRRAAPVSKAPVSEAPVARAPKAAATGTGTLRVSSRPWSLVHVDGKLVGNTPQMNLQLSAGTHRIELVNPEFQLTKKLTVEVPANDTKTLIVDLQ